MYTAPSQVPNTEIKPRPSHEDVDSDIAAFIASGGCIQVIESRPSSPPPNNSCDYIR